MGDKHDTWIKPEIWSTGLIWAPLFSSLSIQLWHCPGQDSCARKWDYVHFLPKGKILLGQARNSGLVCLRQLLHLLLGSFEQMNVNSRSNITRTKQTSLGIDWFFFSSALHVCTILWLNFWGYLQLCLPPKKQLNGFACDMANAVPVCVHFPQIELLSWNYLWLHMLCSKQD